MRISVVVTCFLLFCQTSYAQYGFPERGFVFNDSSLPKIRITIDPEDLGIILATGNELSNQEYLAHFSFERDGQIETMDSIGFRLRGNTSRFAKKKSFKVSFNSFHSQKFHGLKKMNLNGEHNDPSLSRSKLSWDIYRRIGVPGSRVNHVELYINEEFYGVYANIEHIDEEFLQSRFEDASGNLYKCLWPADLDFLGTVPDNYKIENNNRRTYDLKTNQQHDDYSDLSNFITIINTSSDADFECKLEEIFDVDNYLRVAVFDVLSSNWDGQINTNNYYLYHQPCNDKFTFLPYDLDNTFGIDWSNTDWHAANIYNWANSSWQGFPFLERVMTVKKYRDRFSSYMEQNLDDFFNYPFFNDYLVTTRSLVTGARAIDPYSGLDYGWSHAEFESSFYSGVGQHAQEGIMSYMDKRRQNVLSQLDFDPMFPVLVDLKETVIDDSISIKFHANTYLQDVPNTTINFRFDEEDWQQMSLESDSDNNFNFVVPYTSQKIFEYNIELMDQIQNQSVFPICDNKSIFLPGSSSVSIVINECMASNVSLKEDEFGEYEDWVEILNVGNQPYMLNNFYLTDNKEKPNKWRLPPKSLLPNKYYTIWLDNDTGQGSQHANFKLSKGGEFLGLYEDKSDGNLVIDSLTTTALDENQSFGRLPNGTGPFQILPNATFGFNNEESTSIDENKFDDWSIVPNPTHGIFEIKSPIHSIAKVSIYGASGELIFVSNSLVKFDLSNVQSGLYFIRTEWSSGSNCQKLIVY